MIWIIVTITILVLIYIITLFIQLNLYTFQSRADEIHYVSTQDGWNLAIHRFLAEGDPKKQFPVVLFPSLSLSAKSFDGGGFTPSLMKTLAENGFDAWAVDIRGVGLSKPATETTKRSWSFEDILCKDVPSVIDYIRKFVGTNKVHWVGHSMGGHLLIARLAEGRKDIASGIIAGSGFVPGQGGIDYTNNFRKIKFRRNVPLRSLARFSLPIAWLIKETVIMKRNAGRDGLKTILADVHSFPVELMKYALDVFQSGGFRNKGGSLYIENVDKIDTPLMFIVGDKDSYWTPNSVSKDVEKLGNVKTKTVFPGKQYGCQEHYGHGDILLGKNAEQEVYPEIMKWLEAYDKH
ncbi:MAG: alpha/beta fold hydrolase [Candidatus Electryonea clarkiae]|nr:alpha/beta fold hydrolase [Candidatus Electryonea clarkiae]MDP8286558.1 alpha/beta fold hydrolase [Candidatus Electryonea clarkiae]